MTGNQFRNVMIALTIISAQLGIIIGLMITAQVHNTRTVVVHSTTLTP